MLCECTGTETPGLKVEIPEINERAPWGKGKRYQSKYRQFSFQRRPGRKKGLVPRHGPGRRGPNATDCETADAIAFHQRATVGPEHVPAVDRNAAPEF